MEESIYDYSAPVYRVLLDTHLMCGIGTLPSIAIFTLTVIMMNMIDFWCCIIGIVLFIIAKILCRHDPFMLSILFDRLMQPDLWRAS